MEGNKAGRQWMHRKMYVPGWKASDMQDRYRGSKVNTEDITREKGQKENR